MEDDLWAGTPEGYKAFVEMQKLINARLLTEPVGSMSSGEGTPFLFEKAGEIGIVNVKGGIKSQASWIDEWFGAASYPAIQAAIYAGIADPDVKRLVMIFDTPGGQVAGISDAVATIKAAAKIKPIVAVATGTVASAGYWLASSATKFFASPTSVVGSIGVLATHADYSVMLDKAGVKLTSFRSNPEKAPGQPHEGLSDIARAAFESTVMGLYSVFIKDVAANRNRSESYFREGPGRGQTYVGQAAVDMGLVDGIASTGEVYGRMLAGEFDIATASPQNPHYFNAQLPEGGNMTPEQMAALAAAQALGAAATGSPNATATGGDASGAAPETAPASTAPANPAASAAADIPPANSPEPDAVAALTATIAEQATALATAQAELAQANAALALSKQHVSAMAGIVGQAIGNMQIALGQTAGNYEGMDAGLLVAEHTRLTASFIDKFKAGGVSATPAATERATAPAYVPHRNAKAGATLA